MRGLKTLLFLIPICCVFLCARNKTLPPLAGRATEHFFFSRPEEEASLPEKNAAHKKLIELIDSTQTQIDIWCYEIDDPEIIQALAIARDRGVRINITGDHEEDYSPLDARGLLYSRRSRSGLQHAKVMIIDHRFLFSGTGNFTTSDFFHNNNAFFFLELSIESALALERLLSQEGNAPFPGLLDFHTKVLVSPGNGKLIQSQIIQEILRAKSSIRYLIFTHTDPLITAALMNAAARGVSVEGIYDDVSNDGILPEDSEGSALKSHLGFLPSAVYLDGNQSVFLKDDVLHGGKLHHKTMVIDSSRVLTGSYNWSAGARDSNEEIFFKIEDASAAMMFEEEFAKLRAHAKIAARPPASTGRAQFFMQNGRMCSSRGSQFVLFSLQGPLFQAQQFRADASGCADFFSALSTGPGILDAKIVSQASGIADLSFFQEEARLFSLPCEEAPCQSVENAKIRLKDGWIWLPENDAEFSSAFIFSQKGSSAILLERSLIRQGSGFFRFDSAPDADSLILLKSEKTAAVLCAVSGEKPAFLEYLIQSFSFEFGFEIRCQGR